MRGGARPRNSEVRANASDLCLVSIRYWSAAASRSDERASLKVADPRQKHLHLAAASRS